MDMERLIEIIFKDLELSKLKAEERLERLMNTIDIDVEMKIGETKEILAEIASINQMAALWTSYVAKSLTPPALNNDDIK